MGSNSDDKPIENGDRNWIHSADVDEDIRRLRQAFGDALQTVGLTNYAPEWWHWSVGDQYWAHQTKQLTAHYGEADLPRRAAPPG